MIHRASYASALVILGLAEDARAQVDVRLLARAATHVGAPRSSARFTSGRPLPALIELPDGADALSAGLPRIGLRWSALRAPLGELEAFATAHPTFRVTWSAPLRPLIDRAATFTGVPEFRRETLRTGKDVIVGILDTGVDVEHADLRNADGTTRIAYLIDFESEPLGLVPEAEERCRAARLPCAVLPRTELNARLVVGTAGTFPRDRAGHGTHVASLAAGNGGRSGEFMGIAPEASLVVANVIDLSGETGDAGVLLATDLVFLLAEIEGRSRGIERLPAVVNLSFGSDAGPHDGTAPLERGLADLVGPDQPGRAIVVAAGNSAALVTGDSTFPNPLGVHTEVHVPERSSVRVPLVTPPPPLGGDTLRGEMLVWISFRPGDEIGVGIDRRKGPWVSPLRPRESGSFSDGKDLTVTIVNGPDGEDRAETVNAAAIAFEGEWSAKETFAIRFEGRGTANLWIQSDGDLNPEAGTVGALFPGATKEATVTIPATHPELISVGATLSRTDWSDRAGVPHDIHFLGGVAEPPLDSVAFFSSAGPTTDLRFKPDLVAPGMFVAGAMSRDADPEQNPTSVFAGSPFCSPPDSCAVVDAGHAVSAGTSMASPIVAGAVALLFEGDPSLTQDRLLLLLQAGARRPEGFVSRGSQPGAGVLHLPGVLDVERALSTSELREPSAARSWLTLGQELAHPDPTWAVPAILKLRDAEGRVAHGFGTEEIGIEVSRGQLVVPLTKVAPGYHRFAVAADSGTGGDTLSVEVRYRGALLARAESPIAVDVNVAREGFSARGGCAVRGGKDGATGRGGAALAVLAVALGLTRTRDTRCKHAARMVRNRGRTGRSDQDRPGSSQR